jgi:hypothetical protein
MEASTESSISFVFWSACTLACTGGIYSLMPSERWADPRAKLLQGRAWEAARSSVCRTLGRQLLADREIQALAQQLDEAVTPRQSSLAILTCGSSNSTAKIAAECRNRDSAFSTHCDEPIVLHPSSSWPQSVKNYLFVTVALPSPSAEEEKC